ncbi:MAG: hypothetical protein IKT98_06675 [Selenomonadaceae bacterium]|nr:hypothetical protein [Selenomonadaceae bacterium]
MDSEKNIYGLSEGVFKACQFLGLKFPAEVPSDGEHIPSDYFGDDFDLDEETKEKLRSEVILDKERFDKIYESFIEKFASQQPLRQSKTDLNVYFCDFILFSDDQNAFIYSNYFDYFDFEFYKKSPELRKEFRTQSDRSQTRILCNDPCDHELLNNKAETNARFADFLHRDWLNTLTCTFNEFKLFVEKHPRFFSKPLGGSFGLGAEIHEVEPTENLKELFAKLKEEETLLEEVVKQHEAIAAFCPDTVNTIRVNTFLDTHNVVHILTPGGRFGRMGNVVDNFHGGGYSVMIDPDTGIIISDAINRAHERAHKHPDSGKTFKGFQYPAWENLCETVTKMAKRIPQMRHIGWDLAINDKGETVIIEANINPDVDVQQAPDNVGKLYLYTPLMDELQNYKKEEMNFLGYRVNNLRDFDVSYRTLSSRSNSRLKYAMLNLVPDCASLMDLGCRRAKFAGTVCPENVQYIPVDYKQYDDEVILCDFNEDEFQDIKADTCLCAFTAEYVENLPLFINNMCNAAQKQILMWCRPFDKENKALYRWYNPFLTDFTEEFLIKSMEQNNFRLNMQYQSPVNHSIIFYDFRRN